MKLEKPQFELKCEITITPDGKNIPPKEEIYVIMNSSVYVRHPESRNPNLKYLGQGKCISTKDLSTGVTYPLSGEGYFWGKK